jgi:hypothetical protein
LNSSISQTFLYILASSFNNKFLKGNRGDKGGEKQSNYSQVFKFIFCARGDERFGISDTSGAA